MNFLYQLECNKAYDDKLRIDYICDTIGQTPMYGLTITNNIDNEYVNEDKERYKF